MKRHNYAAWKPLLLALGATMACAAVSVAAVAGLTGAGDQSTDSSNATAAALGLHATTTSGAATPQLIEPHILSETISGGADTLTATPEPTLASPPSAEPATDSPPRPPAAVVPAVTPVPPPPPTPLPTPTPVPGNYRPDLSDQLYGLLNNARAANGLAPVSPNDSLIASAQFYTQYIFVNGNPYTLDHWLVGGPGDRAWARGYCCAVGEILVESEGTAQGMVDLWMNSPPHHDIIVDPQYNSIGVACYGGAYVGDDGNVHNPIVCAAEFGSG